MKTTPPRGPQLVAGVVTALAGTALAIASVFGQAITPDYAFEWAGIAAIAALTAILALIWSVAVAGLWAYETVHGPQTPHRPRPGTGNRAPSWTAQQLDGIAQWPDIAEVHKDADDWKQAERQEPGRHAAGKARTVAAA